MSSDADYGQIAGPRVHGRSASPGMPLIGQISPIQASDWSRLTPGQRAGPHPSLGHIKLVIV